MFISYGWYVDEWWIGPAYSSEYNCTAEERATVLQYTLAPVQREYPADFDTVTETGIVSIWDVSLMLFIILLCWHLIGKHTAMHTTLFRVHNEKCKAKSALETVTGCSYVGMVSCSNVTCTLFNTDLFLKVNQKLLNFENGI